MKAGIVIISAGVLICLQPSIVAGRCYGSVDRSSSRRIRNSVVGANIQPHLHQNEGDTKHVSLLNTLMALNVKSLRFPGGAQADNLYWSSGGCEDPLQYPHSPKYPQTNLDGCYETENNLNFWEFLNDIAIPMSRADPEFEIILQINMVAGLKDEKWGKRQSDALSWVRAVRDSAFPSNQVWWEMGNEQYLKSRYLRTAVDYARDVNKIAPKMRREDPEARIMIIGPPRYKDRGFLDRLCGPNGQQQFMEWIRNEENSTLILQSDENTESYRARICPGYKETGDEVKWWQIMYDNVDRNLIDAIALHRYDKRTDAFEAWPQTEQKIGDLHKFAKTAFGDNVKLAITEFNIKMENAIGLDYVVQAAEVIRMHLSFLNIGVDIANMWQFTSRRWKTSMAVEDTTYVDRPLAQYFRSVFRTNRRNLHKISWNKMSCGGDDRTLTGTVLRGDDNMVDVYLVNPSGKYRTNFELNNLWNIELIEVNGLYRKSNNEWGEMFREQNPLSMKLSTGRGNSLRGKMPKYSVMRFTLRVEGTSARNLLEEMEPVDDEEAASILDDIDLLLGGGNLTDTILESPEGDNNQFNDFVEEDGMETGLFDFEEEQTRDDDVEDEMEHLIPF